MVVSILKNKDIKSNKKKFDDFLEAFHDCSKDFTIDCQSLNVDYFNSETMVTIRHRKPAKESIYYVETYKERDELAYFFGLARENTVATSNFFTRGSQIHPILVAILNLNDSSKSNLLFASDPEEKNTIVMLRIDLNLLDEVELSVLKEKNRIIELEDKKAFISFGPIGYLNTLTNIRNFISNVEFEYDNSLFIKISKVSIPENFTASRNGFLNFKREKVIDLNEIEDNANSDSNGLNLKNSKENAADERSEIEGDFISDNSGFKFEKDLNSEQVLEIDSAISSDSALEDDLGLSSGSALEDDDLDSSLLDEYDLENDLYKLFTIYEDSIYIEISMDVKNFLKLTNFINNLIEMFSSICELDFIEVFDMGGGILNISLNISIDDDEIIDLIKGILNKNDFIERD